MESVRKGYLKCFLEAKISLDEYSGKWKLDKKFKQNYATYHEIEYSKDLTKILDKLYGEIKNEQTYVL